MICRVLRRPLDKKRCFYERLLFCGCDAQSDELNRQHGQGGWLHLPPPLHPSPVPNLSSLPPSARATFSLSSPSLTLVVNGFLCVVLYATTFPFPFAPVDAPRRSFLPTSRPLSPDLLPGVALVLSPFQQQPRRQVNLGHVLCSAQTGVPLASDPALERRPRPPSTGTPARIPVHDVLLTRLLLGCSSVSGRG